MENELRFMLSLFEKKVEIAEEKYKEKHKEDFNIQRMKTHVNRKLKREREAMVGVNLMPSIKILDSTIHCCVRGS